MGQVVGVVLGAGSSRRLGRPKQTLPLGDTTVLGWTVRDAEESSLDRIVVVVGEFPVECERAEVVRNAAYGTGCASSLLTGLDAAGDADAIVMLLGDMPGVDSAVIDSVVEEWRAAPSWAAVTMYTDGLGHPFVFSADAFETLRGLHGDKPCGRSWTPSHRSGYAGSRCPGHCRGTSTRGRTTPRCARP